MANNTTAKLGTLIRVKTMASQLTARHPADGINEILAVEIFKPVLIWVRGVGATIEVMSQRIFDSVLVMSILEEG